MRTLPLFKMKAFLDTETTGLDTNARIVEISVCDENERVLLDTFINPQMPIPTDAIRVHGITDDMVKDAPTMDTVREEVLAIFAEYDVMIYNADYDLRLLKQSASGLSHLTGTCVMKPFSELIGEWNRKYGDYSFQPLSRACAHYGVTNPHPHRALGDAISTCRVWHAMSKQKVEG